MDSLTSNMFADADDDDDQQTDEMNNENDGENYTLNSNVSDVFLGEWLSFTTFWNRALRVYQPLEMCVVALGLLGNVLALLTLLHSRKLNAYPSFVYHRVLVAADLTFCVNYFLHFSVRNLLTVECHRHFYRYWLGAFIDGTVNPTVNSVCAYLIMYMTLVIALDRFVALVMYERYRGWNRRPVAYGLVAVSLALSLGVHSWAAMVQHSVASLTLNDTTSDEQSLVFRPCWSEPLVYHWTKRQLDARFQQALLIKDYFNGAIRIGYPLILCVLTLDVSWSFARRHQRRLSSAAAAVAAAAAAASDTVTANVTADASCAIVRRIAVPKLSFTINGRFGGGSFGPACGPVDHRQLQRLASPSPSLRHRQRCERALFYLMMAVVLLAFVQVASVESRRLLHVLFPPHQMLTGKVMNERLPLEDRVAQFRALLYGYQATRILSNFFTAIERSFICFLYIAMNNLFRQELLALFQMPMERLGFRGRVFRHRYDSV